MTPVIFSGIFFLLLFFTFLVCSVANNSITYFKLQFIYNRKVNISIRILGDKKKKKTKKTALHAHTVDSKVELTLVKVVSMSIHHLVSAGNLHAKDFIILKKKLKKEKCANSRRIDISAWGCKMVCSSERDVVLCNECGKKHFCPCEFFGCGCLE